MRLLLVAALCLGVTGRSDGQDWSRFRGPNGSGIAADTGYPTEFGPERHLRWRSAVRPGKSSPVLGRRHIFLTAFDGGTLYTQCFDRETGRLVWERAEQPARHEDAHVLNEPSAATPVTDGDNVYVFFRDLGVISYDPAGAVRWKRAMGPFTNRMGAVTSPIIAGASLVMVLDQIESSSIVALSLATGEVQWTTPRTETDAWATPVLYQVPGAAPQILTAGGGQYGAHALETGERLWTHKGLAPAIVASPVVVGNTVVGFGYGYDSTPPFSAALAANDRDADGRLSLEECGDSAWMIGIAKYYGNRDGFAVENEWIEAWATIVAPSSLVAVALDKDAAGRISPRELWRYQKSFVAVVPSPLVLDGLVYTIKNGGILTVLSADTGAVVKMGRVGAVPASYSASPVTAEGRIYLANEDGTVAVLRAGKDWELVAANDLGEPLYATPALSQGRIVVRGAKSLFCFGSR
ncbi:MAG: PQQ-binding-like beta-propeller repeat protein [Vicinamibacteria bacterium]|nr:PQQ-binding-like beta-propeller repeat protein [Vicinamibacteria bacterium]